MNETWKRFKNIKGCTLESILANKLDTFLNKKEIVIHSVEPLLHIMNNSSEETYWKLDWDEDLAGNDILILKEQQTPEPIMYEIVENPTKQKQIIMGSSFSVSNKLIKTVTGFGWKEKAGSILVSIVLEFEDMYIAIHTGSIIEIKISDNNPIIVEDILFTT